jgi:hypothetical protein
MNKIEQQAFEVLNQIAIAWNLPPGFKTTDALPLIIRHIESTDNLIKIRDNLFPEFTDVDGVSVDSCAYWNLEGAIIDLKRSNSNGDTDSINDYVSCCIRTIERVQNQIGHVKDIIEENDESLLFV